MLTYIRKLFVSPTVEQRAAEAVHKARHDLLSVELEMARLSAHADACRAIIKQYNTNGVAELLSAADRVTYPTRAAAV